MSNSNTNVLKQYVEKRSLFAPFIQTHPIPGLKTIVVIPCFDEPDILITLSSLRNCIRTKKNVEVLVIINSSEISGNEIINSNRTTHKKLLKWTEKHNTSRIKFYSILIENIPKKTAGAGYARKIGMDEAIRRFLQANVDNGIICSLDADSIVAENYLAEIEKLFDLNRACNGCSVYFEHPLSGNEFSDEVYRRVAEYEIHIRYYKLALQYAGFPYYHYTVGSSFAVSAQAYCIQGGMNKKQAGEDFYFLHKIMPMGNFFGLNSTSVYPSPRPSNRVPFGTGPIINQYLKEPEREFLTYNFSAFAPIKKLFTDRNLFFKVNTNKLLEILENYHPSMKTFLLKSDFEGAVQIINENTSQLKSFNRRFFHWFDGFKVVKYLNYSHETHFEKQPVKEAVINYFNSSKNTDYQFIDIKNTLIGLRNIEKIKS